MTVSAIANLLCFRQQMLATPYSLEFWLWSLGVAWTVAPFWTPLSNRIIVWLDELTARRRQRESKRFALQQRTDEPG